MFWLSSDYRRFLPPTPRSLLSLCYPPEYYSGGFSGQGERLCQHAMDPRSQVVENLFHGTIAMLVSMSSAFNGDTT